MRQKERFTCVEMLRLSPRELIVASDTRETYGGRTSDYAQKIDVKGIYAVASSGRVDNAVEIVKRWITQPQQAEFEAELENFKRSFKAIYDKKFKDAILAKYGEYVPTPEEVKAGKIAKALIEQFGQLADAFAQDLHHGFGTAFIFGGWNATYKNMEIYRVTPPGVANAQVFFDILGSGLDLAQPVLSSYIKSLPRNRRDDIPRTEGLYAAVQALYKANMNIGVGGPPDILFIRPDGCERIESESTARLLHNIVAKESTGRITRDRALELFDDIINKKGNDIDIAKELVDSQDPLYYLYS